MEPEVENVKSAEVEWGVWESDNQVDIPKPTKNATKQEKKRLTTKIVIRNLPPTMNEEEFLHQTHPLPLHDNYYFCKADWSLGLEATCRAYVTVKNLEDVFMLRDRFDGYVFVDSKGIEYNAIVEYAPFQGLQKKKSRSSDNKENTIELDPHYKQFLEKLENSSAEQSRLDLKLDFCLERKTGKDIKSTPLLQYLANKKEKRREDARKKNEEKRKLREEKQKQQNSLETKQNPALEQKTPSQTNLDTSGNSGSGVKNHRSKRRFERDQKRREEHEKRKKDKEQNRVEQCKKKDPDMKLQQNKNNASGNDAANSAPQNTKENASVEKKRNFKKRLLKKESPAELNQTSQATTEESTAEPAKHKTSLVSTASLKQSTNPKNSYTNDDDEDDRQSQMMSEERRIRNKDRPSIAIYEPKARTRASDKDGKQGQSKSNANNSDCEGSTKAEFDRNEKRHSSKRSERRYRRKTSEDSATQKNTSAEDANR